MIRAGGPRAFSSIQRDKFDVFIYGLGFESRSTMIASYISPSTKTFALRMPEMKIHSYERNIDFARTRNHVIINNFEEFAEETLAKVFKKRSAGPFRVGIDVSSVNRIMLVEVLSSVARSCEPQDIIEVFYTPAAFEEPSWQFPQIDQIGPINSTFSVLDADPSKPLCLLLGAGFEAGISMGMISQLEPRLCYCFWGTGVDTRFDRAVRRANFNFEFDGFNAKETTYNIKDPKGAFLQLENVVYSLIRDYRIIIVPLGPKLFTFLATLVAMSYVGQVAIWRVQYTRANPPDSMPGKFCVCSILDAELLQTFRRRENQVLNSLNLLPAA